MTQAIAPELEAPDTATLAPEGTEVLVHDDVVDDALRLRLTRFLQGPIWQYGWRSNARKDRFCYWHAAFAGGDGESRIDCEPELMSKPGLECIQDLWRALKSGPLRGHVPLRIYANSHTYGVEGSTHTDNSDKENYFSSVYYAHAVWHRNWSGETLFFEPGGQEVVKAVYPRPGRLITFRGCVPHRAQAPTRDCAELRISIAIKTQLRQDYSAQDRR